MSHIVEAMDKAKLGLATTPMADSPAKRRMATVVAGQAVVAALTPGMPQLEAVSIYPRGNVPARLDFKPQVPPFIMSCGSSATAQFAKLFFGPFAACTSEAMQNPHQIKKHFKITGKVQFAKL